VTATGSGLTVPGCAWLCLTLPDRVTAATAGNERVISSTV
jgi:hypothetical protein